MCGRFAQPRSADDLARIFQARALTDLPADRFNVAPTDPVLAVLERGTERLIDTFSWGLVPGYADSRRGAARLINARSETVEHSPAFRTSYRDRRCILPADAFYEWRRRRDPATGRTRRSEPFAIRLVSGAPMAFAGIWSPWTDTQTGEHMKTVSILTGAPNEMVAAVHDRMPILLDAADWQTWLSADAAPTALRELLRPAPADGMAMYAVSPAVNNVRSRGAELLAPLTRWQAELWPA
jgi:putative SOS response-associated peptidase YedK